MAARRSSRRVDKAAAEQPAARSTYALGESLDLTAATGLAAALLERRGADLELDASAVHRLGGQCLQVLLAAHTTWQQDGHRLRIVSPSPDFTESTTLLGATSTDLLQSDYQP